MRILNHLINILFPSFCKQCGEPVSADATTAYFCKNCWDGIKWFEGPCCPCCGLPYPSMDTSLQSSHNSAAHLCGACHKNPPYFDKAMSAGPYEGVLAETIKLFKYKKKIHIGRALVEYSPLLQRGGRGDLLEGKQACYIIPVPLHPRRLREREFNQSAIIASEIGKRLKIPVLLDALVRSRHTRPQVELDIKERGKNVIGAFTVQNGEVIGDKDIILVDDVYTTGSTINECARTLKRSGAGKVYVVTIARMVG